MTDPTPHSQQPEVIVVDLPPATDLRRRFLRPRTLGSFAIAILIIVFMVSRLEIDPAAVWGYIRNANPLMLLLALGLYYGALTLRAVRWRGMLASAGITRTNGYAVPGLPVFGEIILLSWFVNSVVPAKLGDAYRCYLMKQESGAPFSTSLGTLIAERMIDLSVLFVTMASAGYLAFHGDLPPEVRRTLLIGIAVLTVGVFGMLALIASQGRAERFIPEKIRGAFSTFRGALVACFRNPVAPVLISCLIWALDGVRLWVVTKALGAELSLELALFVALMAALVTVLPVTPAGLGVVEAAVVVVLKLVDVQEDMAASIAVVDRLITFWTIVIVGLVLYLLRMRREIRVAPPVVAEA